ncbi:Uncharacterised protein [Mycobacteroides abscessus subsp. abscessus]|nr:Uncharacterised protein [Mycobacteroides abscessus subsp. abscessus]SIC02446.1 Uncharacterised protein [Mycobacteroides abscessus subsp. abscessus]SIM86265.1 Uncharacterised protein [Mycobacteroides abscessus subsp. abscessus]SIM96157.1 Uncharacterised protein [Mycobacteroides abscessus subsp. abscessus]SKW48695.1 Uncharacterised protein [Mycobacteroides abscessus subsp. abscessus]
MPVACATHMCPHSCNATDTKIASANNAIPIAYAAIRSDFPPRR